LCECKLYSWVLDAAGSNRLHAYRFYAFPTLKRFRVAQILVLPSVQRQGLGRALLHAVNLVRMHARRQPGTHAGCARVLRMRAAKARCVRNGHALKLRSVCAVGRG
jgi:GNAT superfamily N-acetyltransferase